jgi:hypothetical protein
MINTLPRLARIPRALLAGCTRSVLSHMSPLSFLCKRRSVFRNFSVDGNALPPFKPAFTGQVNELIGQTSSRFLLLF